MPDVAAKEDAMKEKMGASSSRNADSYLQNSNNHEQEVRFAAEERQALHVERPTRPTPPNRPLPVITDSASEPRSRSKNHNKPLDELSSAASSPGLPQRQHTPATIPRTKFTSATPLEQRIAINSLKQKLDYDEKEQDSVGNNKRTQNRSELGATALYNDKASISSVTESQTASQIESETSDMVDTTRIMQRLTQVRDYLKQATSLYVNLTTKVHLEDAEMDHIEKLGKLIQQLRLQEQGYVDLLQRTLEVDESADITPSSSVLSLNKQEDTTEEDQLQELKRLQMQHALLKKIVDQQQQIQDLKRKQATLASLQEQAEDLMKAADTAKEEVMPMKWTEGNKRQFDLNEASSYVAMDSQPHEEMDNEEAALFDADMVQRKLELENKLMDLQAKKEKMDSLLSTLKASRDTISGFSKSNRESMPVSNEAEIGPSEREMELLESNRAAIRQQQENALKAMQQARDVQAKLQKLKLVKKRLEDLTHIVAEYESQAKPKSANQPETMNSQENEYLESRSQGNFRGARPRDDFQSILLNAVTDSRDMTNGIDNRMRPTPPGGKSQRAVIDVTRNSSSTRDANTRSNMNDATAMEKNLVSEDQDNDLTSKIRQLQEARQRLAIAQRNPQLLASQLDKNEQTNMAATASSVTGTESESETDSVSTAEDLSWQEDPEFQAKVRKLQQAKEKLKHLQKLVNSVQQDGLAMDELANISLSSKESSIKGDEIDQGDADNAENDDEDETDDEDEITSEQQSEEDDGNENGEMSSAVEEENIDDAASKQSDASTLNEAVVMLDREIEYQSKLKQQKQELEKLLKEKQKLLEAQRQLSEIAKNTLASDGQEHQAQSADVKEKPEIKFGGDGKQPLKKSVVEKTGNRVTYKDLQIPRIVKRSSNLSVEPQYGSDSDIRVIRKKDSPLASKRLPGFNTGSRPNPLVMSELRRQREMFEQNKKLKFVEKQRRKRDSADDNRSDGGTYSIRSDLDEGVGHSMFSADVTTAATWGGSTEQSSSSEEDSAVGEEDFPEEIEDEYEGNMDQPEEEEEVAGDEDVEEDDIAPLLDFKNKRKKEKKEKAWFSVGDRGENMRGKKRKLESSRNGGSVSWSMNVSPKSSSRQRHRQQNLTPAHKLMRSRSSRSRNGDNALWEEQCEQLRQQLSSSTALSTTLLRNQQTLLSMLQNQNSSMGAPGFYSNMAFSNPISSAFGVQRNTTQQQEQQILQSLERCTVQLDRQHQEIQSLQREFQNMLLRQPAAVSNRVYAWDLPSSYYSGYGQRRAAEPLGGLIPNEEKLEYKPDMAHAATSPRIFDDDFRNRFTQTESEPSQKRNVEYFSMFDNQQQSNAKSFSPFNFHDFKEDRKNEETSAAATIRGDERTSIKKQSDSSYNPMVYADSGMTTSAAESRSRDVITTSYPTPSKSKAAKILAERKRATWPSFLKDSENIDSQSERSLSIYGEGKEKQVDEIQKEEKETEEKLERLSIASNFSLFETMRDSIYSEVATLISMNESRPHYLVELFRELQLLTSDYLRQRALYALQDLVTRFLTEDSEMRQSNEPVEEVYGKWLGNEQTPSESVATSDDEQQEAKALEALSSQIRNNDMYDYAEVAETGSTMSTPTSNQDPPFAAESLGDTVINLDEALQKMRSYEERMAEARKKVLNDGDDYGISSDDIKDIGAEAANVAASDNSSAYDVASETSSELQQPSIDTQKLDRQIKSIMMELIPFLNEHRESHCSPLFLNELNNLIFKLAKQKEPEAEKREFGRSFHRQLESVLKDSLSRFEGRILKECGEDILIDISEILFNELAFFRLMQDLDRPSSRIPEMWNLETLPDSHPRTNLSASTSTGMATVANDGSNSSVGFLVNTSGTMFSPPAPRNNGNQLKQSRIFEDGLEIEDLEDNEDNCSDADDETEASRQFVNVELSVSESRPFASTGSGEEDVEEDQQSFPVQNLPPESSVRAQQQQQQLLEHQQQQQQNNPSDVEGEDVVDDVDEMPEDDELRGSPRNVQEVGVNRDNESTSELGEDERGEDERGEDEREEDEREEGDRDNDEQNQVDGDNNIEWMPLHQNNEDGDESEVTIDDLPTKLTGLTEADLQTRMQSEQSAVEGAAGVLAHLSSEQELSDDLTLQQDQTEQQQADKQQQQPDASVSKEDKE